MDCLFRAAGPNSFEPTPLTAGPWRSDAQHGGPPAGLLARMIESVAQPGEAIARLSVELVKPVPLSTLTTTAERQRVSRRVAHAGAELRADGTVVASARALLLATAELPEPGWRPAEPPRRPADGEVRRAPSWMAGDDVAYHRDALELRVVKGSFEQPGPAVAWFRLRQPVVEGEEPTPLQRVAAVSDIASGISAVYGAESGVGLINADLTIAVHRPLVGEWVGIDATTRVGGNGIGLCSTSLFDEGGTVGTATQSLLGLSIGG